MLWKTPPNSRKEAMIVSMALASEVASIPPRHSRGAI
jgi:hypothetical protein